MRSRTSVHKKPRIKRLFGIDLWRVVADEQGVDFELREYGTIGQLKEAFLKDEIDVTPMATVTPDREIYLDFSNHYYRPGVAIAVRAERAGYRCLRFRRLVLDRHFTTVNELTKKRHPAGCLF
jgi:ABC-type amino acid transport substrate-binding protein